MSQYRLADVVAELYGRVHIGPAILFNEEDQRELLLDKFTPWVVNRERGGHYFAEHAHKTRDTLCVLRAWVPRVHENSTGWLIRPMWPTVGSESQNRARVDRLAAYANGSDDHATRQALKVRHSLVSRARIITALVLKGAEGQRRMAQSLPRPDYMNMHQINHVLNELRLCGLWELVDIMRSRCELRTRQLGRECCNEWHAWRAYHENYMQAAHAYVWAVEYLFDIVPMYEASVLDDDDDEDTRKWPKVSCCDPVFYDLDPDDKDDNEKIEEGCSICYGGDDYCRLKKLDCGHAFGESCLLTWYKNRDEIGEPRTCPLCRRLSYNADAFACHVCTATGFHVQLYHLNGTCRCDTVYCKDHLPNRSHPCGGCGVYCYE